MKQKIILSVLIVICALVLPLVHADSIVSQLQPYDSVAANGNAWNSNQRIGNCFTASTSAQLTTFSVELAKQSGGVTPNGNVQGELWSTSGHVNGSPNCITGVGSKLASTNTIAGSTITSTTLSVFTFTFSSGSVIAGTVYIVDVVFTGTGNNMLQGAGSTGTDTSQDVMYSGCNANDWGGSCGPVEDNCNLSDNCPGYQLMGQLGSPCLGQCNWNTGINEASLFVGIAFILVIVTWIKYEGKSESDILIDAAIVLGIFFVILQAIGAILK